MANPTKRTRSVAAAENDENVASSSNASFSSEPQTPRRVLPRGRRTTLGTPSENLPPPSSPTPTRTNTRPLRTRLSLSTPSPSRTPSLTASLFRTPSRSGNGSSASDSVAAIASLRSNGPGSAILTRAASVPTSALALGQIKEAVGGGSAPPPPAKGGSDPDGTPGPSGRGWGKGKENIPPPKDADSPSEGSRKRLRVGRRSSVTPSRARSSSIVSVRSESAGPASIASSLRRTPSCLLSPSPSPSFTSTTTDADTTPTKRETILLTPPPTSPPVDVEIVIEAPEAESVRAASPPSNAYRALKAALRLSSENRTIVGREEEKAVLQSYLSLVSSRDVGMYISGPPGTGKTALTTAVGRELAAQGWHVAEVGVMGLKANDVWARIADDLGCGRSEEEVTAHLAKSRAFIIIDEVDSLLSSSSHVLSKLFSLPLLSADGTVKLVAISNTLDLTVRANLVLPDGAMPQVLPFRAYNATDMAAIVAARVASAGEDAAKVDSRAVELLCRKVEAQNGDLRMCLGVLSSAVSLAEVEWTKKSDRPQVKVALPHVLKAFASHTQQLKAAAGSSAKGLTSATTTKIRSVPLQGRMVLVSLIVFLARTHAGLAGCPAPGANSETLTASTLYATYAHILSHTSSPFPPSPESDYRDLLSNLETLGLVKVAGSGTTARAQRNAGRVELCIREDEVKAGLGIDAIPTDLESLGMAEQEVLRVWIREDGVVARLRARAAAAIERAVNGLEPPPL